MAQTKDNPMALALKTMPLDTAAEVLQYLADNEDFSHVANNPGADLATEEVRALLRELAVELRKFDAAQRVTVDRKDIKGLSVRTKKLLSCLSPGEEKSVFSTFGFMEKR